MTAFYNEHDHEAAEWLRSLIAAGQIAPGIVDERSIEDVRPDELAGFTQVHLFAGIGIWSLALRAAGVPDDYPIWTASCPCQPFSSAGKGAGFDDERHLWPAAYHLISQCRPERIVGEQVDAAIKSGWWDLVADDLEATGYAVAAAVIPSSAVGAPHMRHRLFFTANFESNAVYENLLKVSDLQTTGSICNQQPFGGQVEVRLQSVPKSLESSIFEKAEPAGSDTAQGAEKKISISGEGLFALEKDYVSGESAGLLGQDQGHQEGRAIRLGSACESITEPDRCGVLRTDGHTVSSGLVQELRQPITGQDSAGTWVHVCQREGCLLCDELRAGNMGRSAFALDVGSLEEEKGSLKNDALNVIQAHSKNDNDTGGQTDIGNQGVGAPHIRDRAYWVADTQHNGCDRQAWIAAVAGCDQSNDRLPNRDCSFSGLANTGRADHRSEINAADHGQPQADRPADQPCRCGGASCQLADTKGGRWSRELLRAGSRLQAHRTSENGIAGELADTDSKDPCGRGIQRPGQSHGASAGKSCERFTGLCADGGLADAKLQQRQGGQTSADDSVGRIKESAAPAGLCGDMRPGPVNGYWRAADWLHCRDGKWRPVEPGTFPLAYGMPRSMGAMPPELRGLAELAGLSGASLKAAKAYRTGSLKGYGNAINAKAAQAFIECVMEAP